MSGNRQKEPTSSGRAAAGDADCLEPAPFVDDENLVLALDPPAEYPLPPPSNPDEAAAYVLVNRMLDASPSSREFAGRDGVAVIIEVPSGDWVHPVAEAWRILVRRSEVAPVDGDDVHQRRGFTNPDVLTWFEFRRQGDAAKKPSDGNVGVHLALRLGRSVYGFSPLPDRYLPRDLVRIADLRLTLPPMDATSIAETVTLVVGEAPMTAAPPELTAASVTLDDLHLARRPGQTADDYMARICALARQKAGKSTVTLDALHGMDEAVGWGHDLARDLSDYRRGALPWSAVDRGALLYGPPGTGKTTFARALAATCGVPFIAASLSQWQAAGHLGDLLNAMRRTFAEARTAAPTILFVDEVDSFGDRNGLDSNHRDYGIQVVNAFLEELDGIGTRAGVVVVAACNNPNRLDPALVRSGRLDRAIAIPLPDAEALAKILRCHLGTDLSDADLSGAALLALGGSGADCERWVRGARRRARHAGREMKAEDLSAEIRGTQRERSAETLRRCAVHEMGHALVTVLERPPGSLLKASLQQGAGSGGAVMSAALDDAIATRAELEVRLRQLLAGRAAEEVILGEVSSGAGGDVDSDLAKATTFAAALVCSFGLDEDGDTLLWTGMPQPESLGTMLSMRPDIAKRVSAILTVSYQRAKALIEAHRNLADSVADLLLKRGVVDGNEVEALLRGPESLSRVRSG